MNKKTRLSVAKISIPGTQSDELCYVFSEHLDSNNPNSDTVFGIFQIRSSHESYQFVIEQIVKHILDFYYKTNENRSPVQTEHAIGASEFLFENALQYANDQVITLMDEMQDSFTGRKLIDRSRISLLIGVVSNQDLYLTSIGNAVRAYMLYPVTRNGTFSHYSAVSVTEEYNQERSLDPKKLFTNVIAGTFAIPGSTLVVCNGRFNDYIPIDQIKQIVTSYPFDHVSKYLYNLLGKANENTDFNALLLSLQESDTPDTKGAYRQTRSDESINELVEQQKNTQHIMSPVAVNHIKEQVGQFMSHNIIKPAQTLRNTLKNVDYERQGKRFQKWSKKMAINARRGVSVVKKNYKNPISTVQHLSIPKTLPKSLTNLQSFSIKKIADVRNFYARLRSEGPRYLVEWFKALPMLSKGLLALAIIFLFLFVTSIASLNRKNAQTSKDQAYTAQVNTVEQKISQAESSMIFEDESHATLLLQEASAALLLLPRNNADQLKTSDTLKQRIEQAQFKIRKIYAVKETQVANLSNQIPTLDGLGMTAAANTVLLFNNDSIYTLSRSDGRVTQLNTQAKIPSIGCGAALSDALVYFCGKEGDRLYEINTQNKETKQVTIKLAPKEMIKYITFYNNRLYVLDPTTNTVYRHSKTKDGFGSPVQWFNGTENASIDDAHQIIIDGSGNVLKQGIAFLHINSGKASPISIPNMDPKPTSFQQFWTSEDSNYYYLLDATNHRIIVLQKTNNRLVAQLTSDSLTTAISFTVNEQKKEILALTNTALISLPLTFLK